MGKKTIVLWIENEGFLHVTLEIFVIKDASPYNFCPHLIWSRDFQRRTNSWNYMQFDAKMFLRNIADISSHLLEFVMLTFAHNFIKIYFMRKPKIEISRELLRIIWNFFFIILICIQWDKKKFHYVGKINSLD